MNVNVKKGTAGRKRRLAGWTLLVLGLLVTAVLGWSWSRRAYSVGGAWGFELANGQVRCILYPGANISGDSGVLLHGESERFLRLRTRRSVVPVSNANKAWDLYVVSHFSLETAGVVMSQHWNFVLWPLPLMLWAEGGLLVRSGVVARRRAETGLCRGCGYDLAGLGAGAKCPECGREPGRKKRRQSALSEK